MINLYTIKPIFIFDPDGAYNELLNVILGRKAIPKPKRDEILIKFLLFTSISLLYSYKNNYIV